MPRWLLQGLVVFALIAAGIGYINLTRVRVPDACRAANTALEAENYNAVIDNLLQCLDEGDLPPDLLAQVYFALGNAYTALGNYDQSVRDYSEALRHEPDQPWALNNRCWSYGHLRRGQEALQDCNQALRILPDQPEILDSRALAHWVLGDLDRARRDLDRAHRANTSFPPPEQRLQEFEALF